MNQIISIRKNIISGQEVQTVNARELHAGLGLSRDFNQWMREQIERVRLMEGRDWVSYEDVGNVGGGRPRKEYAITIEAAKHIAMMSGTDKGFDVREYFIECERRANTTITQLPDFTNPAVAARAWADAIEQTQALAIERDHAVATKAQIGSRREATAMATAAKAKRESDALKAHLGEAAKSASVMAVEGKTKRKFEWRPLRDYCNGLELEIGKSFNPGIQREVNTYPAQAWMDVYEVDLVELFGEQVAA